MDRAAIEAIVTKWERWAAREMWITEHLHPRAKTALVTELAEAFAAASRIEIGIGTAQDVAGQAPIDMGINLSSEPKRRGRPKKERVE